MSGKVVPIAMALLSGLAAIVPMAAWPDTGEELALQAKLTLMQARAIAVTAVSGTIIDQELEREPGGSGLRYSFDVNHGGTMYEVGVDAQTGIILENKAEGAHPD